MFREDNLAAAQIAQIFGSELLKVQQSAQTDSGSMPDIVKLDPKQFLMGETHYRADRKAEELRLIQALQMEAESVHPLPPEQSPAARSPVIIPEGRTDESPVENYSNSSVQVKFNPTQVMRPDAMERIANSLERIANSIEKVEIKTKKKTIKRNKTKVAKPSLLNEVIA